MSYRAKHIKPKIKHLKPKKHFFQNLVFWISLGVLFIGVGLYFFLFFHDFQVQKIIISGNQTVKSTTIENTVWPYVQRKIFATSLFDVSSKSIFIVDRENIVENVLHAFPIIEKVSLYKKIPSSLLLDITERKPVAVFCKSEQCFSIDKNGVIFKGIQSGNNKDIIIRKPTDATVHMGDSVIDPSSMEMISRVAIDLQNNFQISVTEAFVANPLVFTTQEGWRAYFDPTSDIDLQIAKMNILLKDEIPLTARGALQYIYLQYKDRAYYK